MSFRCPYDANVAPRRMLPKAHGRAVLDWRQAVRVGCVRRASRWRKQTGLCLDTGAADLLRLWNEVRACRGRVEFAPNSAADGLHGIRGRSSMLYFVAFAGAGERPIKATVVSAIPWSEVSEDVVQVTSATIPHCHRWVRADPVLWPPSKTARVASEACLPAFRPEKP